MTDTPYSDDPKGQPRERATRPDAPNISTEHQEEGDAARPSDTLDRTPKRDPLSGQTIPDDYDPARGRPEVQSPGSESR